MSNQAYLNTQPVNMAFESENKIRVSFTPKLNDAISIQRNGGGICINVDEIEWLRQVLDDAKEIYKMNKED